MLYDFCRSMELLPTELFCDLCGLADFICDSNFHFTFFELQIFWIIYSSKSSVELRFFFFAMLSFSAEISLTCLHLLPAICILAFKLFVFSLISTQTAIFP